VSLGLSAQEQAPDKNGIVFLHGYSVGILNGYGEEVVYGDAGSSVPLSQLLWYMEPLVYTGANLDFTWHKPANRVGLFTNVSFKFGFPGKTGITEDRDWIAADYPNWLTHYSVHDNYTDRALFADANFGIAFSLFDVFLLKTYVAYDYMLFSWTAKGGSFLYPRYSDGSEGHGYLRDPESVGSYRQTWHILSPGLALYGTFNRFFNAEIAIKATPVIWSFAEDNHLMRDLVITDTMQRGLFIEPKCTVTFTPVNIFSLSFAVSWKDISRVRGDSYYDYSDGVNPDFTIIDRTGAAYRSLNLELIGRFRLIDK
jgi:outer membrane protease